MLHDRLLAYNNVNIQLHSGITHQHPRHMYCIDKWCDKQDHGRTFHALITHNNTNWNYALCIDNTMYLPPPHISQRNQFIVGECPKSKLDSKQLIWTRTQLICAFNVYCVTRINKQLQIKSNQNLIWPVMSTTRSHFRHLCLGHLSRTHLLNRVPTRGDHTDSAEVFGTFVQDTLQHWNALGIHRLTSLTEIILCVWDICPGHNFGARST